MSKLSLLVSGAKIKPREDLILAISLPLLAGRRLPVRLGIGVPISNTTPTPIEVPVAQQVNAAMHLPAQIELREAALDPTLEGLRLSSRLSGCRFST